MDSDKSITLDSNRVKLEASEHRDALDAVGIVSKGSIVEPQDASKTQAHAISQPLASAGDDVGTTVKRADYVDEHGRDVHMKLVPKTEDDGEDEIASPDSPGSPARRHGNDVKLAHRENGHDRVKSENNDDDDVYTPSAGTPLLPASFSPAQGASPSSQTPTPPPDSAFPVDEAKPKKGKKSPPPPPQIIEHLPIATTEAKATFEELTENHYQYAKLGRSREAGESMSCDCSFDPANDHPSIACGDGSDCINRLTQIECLPGDCRCRKHCQNQRFQKRQYAHIEVVQTEMKGFGLRAESELPRDSFIYEYVGDVVSQPSFAKRMRDYADEGIRHFYFMMLQKDEFIDATKRGGLGRFANHSCSPNCYVAKWFIGSHVRMGIFAKRKILKGEELTFNYNVDRYGHEAQTCYCGEPNCVGFIGGKTQTDIVTVDDLFLDALGISDEQRAELKGNRKKKGKKLDDPDFQPDLYPVAATQMSKVYQAIRQTQSRKVLTSLLIRIKLTVEDPASLRAFLRLRGMSLLTMILEDNNQDAETCTLAMECLAIMPLLNKGKVEDSNVKVQLDAWVQSESSDEGLKALAQKLLEEWAKLPERKRITKRVAEEPAAHALVTPEEEWLHREKRRRADAEADREIAERKAAFLAKLAQMDHRPPLRVVHITRPPPVPETPQVKAETLRVQQLHSQQSVIENARLLAAAAEEARVAAEEEAKRAVEEKERKRKERKERHEKARADKKKKKKTVLTPEAKDALKEKKLLKLISPIVVKTCQKYSKDMGVDLFKKHAKELSEKIAEKEKKSAAFKEGRLDSLSDEKVAKVQKFAKDYFVKEAHRLKKAQRSSSGMNSTLPPSLSSTSSTAFSASPSTSAFASSSSLTLDRSFSTPDSALQSGSTPDSELMNGMMEVSVDEVMGFGDDDDDDGAEDMSVDDSDDDDDVAPALKSAPGVIGSTPISYTPALGVEPSPATAMDGVESTVTTTDPRIRPP